MKLAISLVTSSDYLSKFCFYKRILENFLNSQDEMTHKRHVGPFFAKSANRYMEMDRNVPLFSAKIVFVC